MLSIELTPFIGEMSREIAKLTWTCSKRDEVPGEALSGVDALAS